MVMTPGTDGKGRRYLIDWEAANSVVGAYAYMRGFHQHAKLGQEANLLGKVKIVDVEPRAVQNTKRDTINRIVPKLVWLVQTDAVEAQRYLASMRRQTMDLRQRRNQLFATAEGSSRSFNAWAGIALNTTQLVRDVGFAAVAVIGAPMGGGIAVTAALTAAGGSAGAKYSETGNAGAAILSGSASLLMAGYGRLITATAAEGRGVMIGMGVVIDSTFEMFGGMAEGKTAGETFKAVLVKALAGGLNIRLDRAAETTVNAITQRIAKMTGTMAWRDPATLTAIELAKKTGEKGIGLGADWLTSGSAAAGAQASDHFVVQKVLCIR